MLGIDEGNDATHGLGLCENLERERGLARGLGAIDLHDAAPGNATDAKGDVKGEGARGDGLDVKVRPALAILHDRALAELLLNLGSRGLDHLRAFLARGRRVNLSRNRVGLSHLVPFHCFLPT